MAWTNLHCQNLSWKSLNLIDNKRRRISRPFLLTVKAHHKDSQLRFSCFKSCKNSAEPFRNPLTKSYTSFNVFDLLKWGITFTVWWHSIQCFFEAFLTFASADHWWYHRISSRFWNSNVLATEIYLPRMTEDFLFGTQKNLRFRRFDFSTKSHFPTLKKFNSDEFLG